MKNNTDCPALTSFVIMEHGDYRGCENHDKYNLTLSRCFKKSFFVFDLLVSNLFPIIHYLIIILKIEYDGGTSLQAGKSNYT